MRDLGSGWRAAAAALAALLAAGEARGQADADEAAVVVEGRVRAVYQGEDRLVELEARRAELGGLPLGDARAEVPSPGDLVYVHTTDAAPAAGRQARAFLVPRKEGGWRGRLEPIGEPPGPRPTPGPAPSPSPSGLAALGLTAEEMEVKGGYALKVTAVDRSKPAGRAGLEVGDVVVGVGGKPLSGPRDLDARLAQGGRTSLTVVDINTGKVAQVPVDLGEPAASNPAPAPEGGQGRSLGITAEPVKVDGRGALKVVKVDPAGAGARAGLEPGDVLVSADGAPLTGPEQLAAALRKGGPVVELLVRDTRTGKDVPVPVRLGGRPSPSPSPSPMPRPRPSPAGPGTDSGIGAKTELVFLDTEAAVKVAEVVPGGPAARAGLKPGDIIVEAAGKPVLHPDELTEAVKKQATGTLQLTVLPQGSGRRTAVKVELGR